MRMGGAMLKKQRLLPPMF